MSAAGMSGGVESPASSSGAEAVSADAPTAAGNAESSRQSVDVHVSLSERDYLSASTLWRIFPEGWDRFRECGADWWIVRPPAGLLKLGLEALSPGLDGRTMQRLNVLADELMACGHEEEPMVGVCQEMRELLQEVLETVAILKASIGAIRRSESFAQASESFTQALHCTLLIVIWAFTWVETLLLEHVVLGNCSSEEMQTVSERWETLHQYWPQELKGSKRALDMLRRVAMLSCGQDREAVENFEAPDFWKGFETCFLCVVTSAMCNPGLRKPGRLSYGYTVLSQMGNKCLKWIQRAERAGPRNHEHWPFVRARVLMLQLTYFTQFDQNELSIQVSQNVLEQIQWFDLRPRFDFPVPLPNIELLKLTLLEFLAHNRNTGWQFNELVHGIGPEVLDRLDGVHSVLQARYACYCLVLRGDQLISHFGQVEEGLELFDRCLAKLSADSDLELWLEKSILETCQVIMARDIANGVHLDRGDRLQAFLVAHGKSLEPPFLAHLFLRNAWAVCGFSGPAMFMPSVVPALSPSEAELEAFWKSYNDSCAALSFFSATEPRYEVKHLGTGDKLQLAGSWVPHFCLFHVHVVAATVSKLLPPNAESADGAIARQALLSLESGRNSKQPNIDWERIQRAHRACGSDTVFVQFAGLTSHLSRSVRMLDVCIVVQDEGVCSCHRLDWIDSDSILESVREISDACERRQLEDDCCRNALETLYDVLIRPLFHDFIRDKNSNPHRKLVISAVGCFQNVPFSILRNRDSGCYLFEEVKLALTPSFLMLEECQLRYESLQETTLLSGAGAAVALGDPLYLPFEDKPLPGSRKEVDAICELFQFCHPDHEIVKLLGADATVERLLEWVKKPSGVGSGTQGSQAFIHIAAHGTGGKGADHGTLRLASATTKTRRRRRAAQVRDEPEQSSDEESYEESEAAVSSDIDAVLSQHLMLQQEADRAAEGLEFLSGLLPFRSSDVGSSLHCDDIRFSGSKWCAYMVVLSACSTAVGVPLHLNVLDVLSFGRAFMNVGVPCSVLAQWRVNDSVTGHLMPLFYEALRQGEDACSALQSAMIKMHQTGEFTLHQLAPFVVTGLPTVCLPPQMRRCQPALELASSISKLQHMKFKAV